MQASDGKAQQQQPDDPLMSDGAAQCVSFLLVIALTLDPFPIEWQRGTEGRGGLRGKCAPAVGKALAWNWVLSDHPKGC